MEVVLVRFVGAGLASALSGLSPSVPREYASDGLSLISELAAEKSPVLQPLLAKCAHEIVRGWRGANVPDPTAVQHLQALPSVLQSFSPKPGQWSQAFSDLTGQADRKLADGIARGFSAEIVSAASAAGEMQKSGLLVQVSMVLLHRLIEALLNSADDVGSLSHLMERLAHHDTAGDKSGSDALTAAISRQALMVCPEPLLRALVEAARARGVTDAEIELTLEAKAQACQEHFTELKALIKVTGDELMRSQLETFRDHLDQGRLAEAEDCMANAEDAWAVRPYSTELSAEGNAAAAAIRQHRARLNDLRDNWQDAARDYAVARRFYSSYDVKGRWRLMMRQAAALSRHGVYTGDIRALFEAAQIHAEAGGLLQEHDAPIEWATAHVELGNLLLNLAEREGRPERYLAAALHFKPAVDVFSREDAMEDWALAQLGLANALKGQGEHQGDPVILSDAVFAYRAALGMLHSGRSPKECIAAKLGIGTCLVRIAEEADEPGLMEEAIASLKQARAAVRGETGPIEAALGRAYVILASEKEDSSILNEAVAQIQRALDAPGQAVDATEIAKLLRLLGTSQWALGEAAGDAARMQAALATLVSARDSYAAAGESSIAAVIGKDISNYEVILVRMRRSQRHAGRLKA